MADAYQAELTTAIDAVRRAAAVTRSVQQQITSDVLQKKDRSPVTVADFGSQAVVCKALLEAFADDPVIAEEDAAALREGENAHLLDKVVEHVGKVHPGASADDACNWIDHGGASRYSDRFWTLDPIDGTKGFLRAEQYAIALALIVEGRPAVAALACPNLPVEPGSSKTGAIFAAVAGSGARVRPIDEPDADPQPIGVSATDRAAEARFCESVESAHSSHSDSEAVAAQLSITHEPVRLDSQAKYAVVARGEADIYMRLPTRADYVERIWDHAAGALVVTEAGGRATDVDGKALDFNHGPGLEHNRGVIVTNNKLHDAVLAALESVYKP